MSDKQDGWENVDLRSDNAHQHGVYNNRPARIDPISLTIDPGDASPAEIAELFVELDVLYRMMGGSGINWQHTA